MISLGHLWVTLRRAGLVLVGSPKPAEKWGATRAILSMGRGLVG